MTTKFDKPITNAVDVVVRELNYPNVPVLIQNKQKEGELSFEEELHRLKNDFDAIDEEQRERFEYLMKIGFGGYSTKEAQEVNVIKSRLDERERKIEAITELQSFLKKNGLKYIPSDTINSLIAHDIRGKTLYRRFVGGKRMSPDRWGVEPEGVIFDIDKDFPEEKAKLVHGGLEPSFGFRNEVYKTFILKDDLVLCDLKQFNSVIPTQNLKEMANFPLLEDLTKTAMNQFNGDFETSKAKLYDAAVVVTPAVNVRVEEQGELIEVIDPAVLVSTNNFSDESEIGRLRNKHGHHLHGYILVTVWGDEALMPEFMKLNEN